MRGPPRSDEVSPARAIEQAQPHGTSGARPDGRVSMREVRRIPMCALADLDEALARRHTTLDDLNRRVTCLKRVL